MDKLTQKLIKWSEINSHSLNIAGIDLFRSEMKAEYETFAKEKQLPLKIEEVSGDDFNFVNKEGNLETKTLAKNLSIKRESEHAQKKILLVAHMDTVFPKEHHFQKTNFIDDNTLNGPGVSDIKGGILVMLEALKAFENSEDAGKLSWEVFLNSDEEIGSPGSSKLLAEKAKEYDFGLVFEPSLPDGSIAYIRKGSGNYSAVFRGQASHVGREFAAGKNAILAAMEFAQKANELNSDDLILNIGFMEGGGPVNVVPDLCIVKLNIRSSSVEAANEAESAMQKIINKINQREGFSAEFHGSFNRKPKNPNKKMEELFALLKSCAEDLGIDFKTKNTGGCCDGNNLLEHGLVNIDTLGVRGANIHSDQEYVLLDSVKERIALNSLLLKKLSSAMI